MLELAYPWLLTLLPAPIFVWWLLPAHHETEEAVRMPFFNVIAKAAGQTPSPGAVVRKRRWALLAFAGIVWTLLLVALARPEWVDPPVTKSVAARDLMLAVDLSGSMAEEDFTDASGTRVSRLEAVQQVLSAFIERRGGDRIGLIVFGNAPYIQAPFTEDHGIVRYLLDEARVAMAGPQTMLGDAIGFSIPRFDESESKNRVLILLTDGNDTGSRMPPDKAAAIAADHDITIHTVAIGDPGTVGESALDEATLEDISTKTGGRTFFAGDRAALDGVYQTLDKLEPGQVETLSWRPRRALFQWPAGAAALLFVAYHAVVALTTRRKRGPRV